MTPDSLFQIASAAVLPGWLALALAPLARARCVAIARIIAVLLSGLYVSLLVAGLAGEGPPAGAGFDTLDGVRLLLSSPAALLAGWVHYLVFDLWVGSWEAEDDALPHWLLLPCLALTFLAGPTGLLLYHLLKAARKLRT
ncbi:abscisic acid-deficient protein Aba4 family protein [Sandarakinorhabdus sp.]|uniref:abscisic acid-deficient protein Aba4 family protein n=1 Tax=Sandarakinorhabdus sp. TaxID=1916663 RepID=UPI003F6EEBAD